MVEKDLRANLEFVEENKQILLKEHNNKFLLVHNQELVSSYDTYEKAAEAGINSFGLEANFLVYRLIEKEPLNFVMGAKL